MKCYVVTFYEVCFLFSHVSVLIYSSLTMFNPIYDVTKGIVITTIYLRIQNVSQT